MITIDWTYDVIYPIDASSNNIFSLKNTKHKLLNKGNKSSDNKKRGSFAVLTVPWVKWSNNLQKLPLNFSK